MIRGLIRDLINMYIGIRLMQGLWENIGRETLFLYGFAVFFFSFWFTLERVGLIPKLS